MPVPAVHPLKVANFRSLWVGLTISLLGDQFYFVALPWVILQMTGSPVALGTVLLITAVPRSVFMLIGGVVSDRFSSRRILIVTGTVRMLAVAAMAALLHFHAIRAWHLSFLAVAFGVADAFSMPAWQALTPPLVNDEQLPAANALISGSEQVSSILGPAPAGLAVRLWGVASAFLIDAVSFGFVIVALLCLPESSFVRDGKKSQGVWRELLEGFEYVAKDPPMRSLLLLIGALNIGVIGPLSVGLAVIGNRRFGSSAAFGAMLTALAAGELVGSLLPAAIKTPRKRGLLLLMFCGLLGIGMMAIGFLTHLVAILVVLVLLGSGNGLAVVYLLAWFQARVDPDLLGRLMSILMFAVVGLSPLSYAVAGILVNFSIETMFIAAGTLVLATAFFTALSSEVSAID
jgi:MFS family permease